MAAEKSYPRKSPSSTGPVCRPAVFLALFTCRNGERAWPDLRTGEAGKPVKTRRKSGPIWRERRPGFRQAKLLAGVVFIASGRKMDRRFETKAVTATGESRGPFKQGSETSVSGPCLRLRFASGLCCWSLHSAFALARCRHRAPAISSRRRQFLCPPLVIGPKRVYIAPLRSLRLAVRTSPSHGGNRGSIPLGSASCFNEPCCHLRWYAFAPKLCSGKRVRLPE